MNRQRVFALVGKELKRTYRDTAVVFMIVVFPLVLTVAFGASFGAIGGGENKYPLAVVNQDAGSWGAAYTSTLAKVQVLTILNYTDPATAQFDLQQGRLKAVLIIPRDFTESLQSYVQSPTSPASWHNTTLGLLIDKGSMTAGAAVPPIIQQTLNTLAEPSARSPLPVAIGAPSLVDAQVISQFSYMAPGLFSFAAIFLIMLVSQALTTERAQGILSRISVTPTSTNEIFSGLVVSNVLVSAVQVALVFLASYAMGFRPQGGLVGVAVATVFVLILTVCSVGFGLITAAIARSEGAATGISFIFLLPQMLLGTFVPAPEFISRLVPTYYVTDSLSSIFLRGASVTSPAVLSNLLALVGSSAFIIVLGIVLFKRLGSR